MLFRNKCIVGLDIGSSSIKAVELESSSAGYKLTGFGYAALPSEAIVQGSFMNAPAISSAIRDACDAGGIKATEVASSVSGHSVIVKRITLPIQSEDELEETIRWEAEQYIPFDINEVNIDHQVLKEDTLEGQMDIILVAAKKDLIDDYTSVIADAGLSLAVLDVDSFAVGNMYEYCYQPSDTTTVALVDIGASVININVMAGSVPAFTRDITTGGNQYTEEIQKTLGISSDEAERIKVGGAATGTSKDVVPQEVEEAMRDVSENLLSEIERSLDFYRATNPSGPLERMILCGGAARVAGLDRLFQGKIEIPVDIADPFSRVQIGTRSVDGDELRELASSLCVALGLAMRKVQ
jgi:type IV pilus assembly protein PilM